MKSFSAGDSGIAFPVFVKACHITQGGQNGWMRVASAEKWAAGVADAGADPAEDLRSSGKQLLWALRKWDEKAVDVGRPWETAMGPMLASLAPGIMAVQGFPAYPGAAAPYEVKVEVVWGQAYIALPQWHNEHQEQVTAGAILRPCEFSFGSDETHNYHWACERLPTGTPGGDTAMDFVWKLSEQTARAAGADQMRVDVFMDRNNPTKPVVNEISLFSMTGKYGHTHYLGKLWFDGYRERRYRLMENVPDEGRPYLV